MYPKRTQPLQHRVLCALDSCINLTDSQELVPHLRHAVPLLQVGVPGVWRLQQGLSKPL
jgi:hypothetical protein